MKKRYAFHHRDYGVGENEKLYSDMASKGWRLIKRGNILSSFEKAPPEKRLYRLEFSPPVPLDDEQGLPPELIAEK